GYRTHSRQYQTRVSTFFESEISKKSLLSIYGYYVNGYLELPGSLSLTDYILNDTAANSRDLDRHTRRISKKGRLGITFNTKFGKDDNNIFEITAYGTIKDLERVSQTYRIFARSGIGASFRYINKLKILGRKNEFSIGGDLYYQSGPIEEFNSVLGAKGDELKTLFDESISNAGFYAMEKFSVIKDRLDLLFTGRYDRVIFNSRNLLQSEFDTSRVFARLTPKAALNFKITPRIALYGSFGLGFDSPAFNEMDNYIYSSNPNITLNPDLEPQKSQNIEFGIKGDLPPVKKKYFKNTFAEITFFRNKIEDEIVPFTVDNVVFFRNAANTKRTGLEIGINTEPIQGLNIKTAYTYSDFKYEKYLAGTIDIMGALTNHDFSGNIMPSIPKNLFSSDISYQYTFQKNYNLFIKLHHEFVDRMFVNDRNDEKTEKYNLFNAQIGINMQIKNFTLLAYGGLNNIANKKYVSFIQINSDDRREFYEAGAPRNFFGGITIGYIFNK
ncbi:MAG: TonB-dependent receptor domain-containing protein, partial [Ignavibacteria bacterium]